MSVKKPYLNSPRLLTAVLIILCLAAFFFNLGNRSLWEPDEGRYAEIARRMIDSGDWLTPRMNYIKHFDKPPVAYWVIALSLKFLGFNEFSAHLPLVMLGLGGVFITFLIGKELFGKRAGLFSAIILVTSLGYPAISRIVSSDIVLTFFILCCYLFFIRKKYLLFYFSMGLAFMTKGPVTLIQTLLPVLAFVLYEKESYPLKEIKLGKGILLFALTGLPWFIHECIVNEGLWTNWVFQQTVNRVIRHQGRQPFYFFIPALAALFFPWTFFLFPSLKGALSLKKRRLDNERRKILFLFFWFFLPFLFFACIGKKLVPYILPLLVPLAIIGARMWDKAMDNLEVFSKKTFSVSCRIFSSFLALLSVSMIVFLLMGFDYRLGIEKVHYNIVILSTICAGGAAAVFSATRQKNIKRLFLSTVLTGSLFFLVSLDVLPKIEANTNKSVKILVLKIQEDLKPEDKIVNYRCFLRSLPFYLGRRTIVIERQRLTVYEENDDWKEYLLKDKKDLYRLLSSKERVYCITYPWEFEKIEQEYHGPITLLGQTRKYVLFVNRKVRE